MQGGNEDHSNPSNWASATITFVVALRGHSSRIFRHVWSQNTLITGGEDSKLLIWLDPANEKGEPSQIKAHSGSPVWALCTDPDKGLAYTGGGDGALRAWPSRTEASTKALKSPTEGEEKDQAIAVKFLTPCQILILTVGGNLYRHDLNRDEIQLIFSDDTLKNYGLVDTTFEGQILLGNLSGDLIRLNENESGEFIVHQRERIHEGKMFSLHVIGGQEVLTCGSEGSLQLMLSGGKTVSLRLPKTGDQRWVSSATISPNGSKLAVGDRCGSLHIYDLNGDSCDPEQTLKKIHGRLGIGDVVFASDSLLKSAGRDGLIKSSRFHNSEWTITSSEHLPIKWLERRAMSQGEELILGFQSSDFVVYSLSEQRPILEINCGGSHRSWDFVSNPGGNATFTFIKDKEVFISDIPLHILCKSNLKQPFHSREVSLVHHFALCDVDYLVTAGEDVVIKIHKLSNDCTKRQTILNLKSHISSVKTVKTLRLDDNTLLMASAGGRAQLTLWKISVDVGTSNLTVMELTSHLLKGNDRKRKKTWKDSETVFDTETRYMDLEIIRAEDGQIKIVTACSDGVLLVWNVSSDMKKLEQSCESPSIEHCFLRLCNLSGQIVSGSTDGFIRHWGVTNSGQIELEKEYRTHQSGVNSLHVSRDLVASGSDAGAIGLDDFRIPEQHACQITGIHRIGSRLITVSVDQRLTIWNFGGDKTLTFCGQILSDVADIQDMAVWSKGSQNFVAVAGEGLGIYKLRL